MSRFRLSLLLLLVLGGSPVFAQESAPGDVFADVDPLEGVMVGDRVEIGLVNGNIFRGELRALFKDRVKMDVSFENPNLDGTLTFMRKQVRKCRILPAMTDEERRLALEAKRARRAAYDQGTSETPAPTEGEQPDEEGAAADGEGKEGAKKKTPEEKAKEAQAQLLAQFPPDVWTEKKYAELVGKEPSQLAPEEAEFIAKYPEWLKAREGGQQADRGKLLERFPPPEWGPEKNEFLKSKLAVLGIPPTEDEVAFMESFDDWTTALKDKEEADRAAAEQKGDEEKAKAEEEAKKAQEKERENGEGNQPEGEKTEGE